MNKKILVIVGVIVLVGLVVAIGSDSKKTENNPFHVTLADPKLYIDGKFTEQFFVDEGTFLLRFVPNGDSPKILSISMQGDNVNFFQNFELVGTPHNTGISEYFTWDYDGEKSIQISKAQEVKIIINPNGNLKGPVSVDLIHEK